MQIFVKTLTGKTITLENVKKDDSIDAVKAVIQEHDGTPMAAMILTYEGHLLEAGRTVGDYDIIEDATLHVSLRLRGGMLVGAAPRRGAP